MPQARWSGRVGEHAVGVPDSTIDGDPDTALDLPIGSLACDTEHVCGFALKFGRWIAVWRLR
jgi:hypothetical protein